MKLSEHAMPVSIRPASRTLPAFAAILIGAAVAWAYTIGRSSDMGAGPGTMGLAVASFVGMWVVMMAAMMWPAIFPTAIAHGVATARGSSVRVNSAAAGFALGFLAPWALYGLAMFAVLSRTGSLAGSSQDAAKWLGVAIFGAAGIYQLTPAKRRALDHCRMAIASPHASRGGELGSVWAGVFDGAMCVACCFALMALLIPAGVMNLPAMVALTGLILSEKLSPRPHLVARLAGVGMLAAGAVTVFFPALMLPGLHTGMSVMGGM